ncbi:MAG TPA: protein rep [Trinickia sp.]|uniref:protein rep n=1 Tax=Trinickia sp. TaxID=2571163 RepID=UPI002D104854|nr:protein rep [Trinickia sp.]HVW49901.1 protein rep [Trinickia sp.]
MINKNNISNFSSEKRNGSEHRSLKKMENNSLGSNRKSTLKKIIVRVENEAREALVKDGNIEIQYTQDDKNYLKFQRQNAARVILFERDAYIKSSQMLDNKSTKKAKVVDGKTVWYKDNSFKQHATCNCMRYVRDITAKYVEQNGVEKLKYQRETEIAVYRNKDTKQAYFGNLTTCGMVWTCPVCASKISEHRRQELTELIEKHNLNKGFVYMLTLTLPHYKKDNLKDLMDRVKKAMKYLTSHYDYRKILKSIGQVGSVRALEVTWSYKNGWHPHFHILQLTDMELFKDNFTEVKEKIWSIWVKACVEAGLNPPSLKHGVDFQGGQQAGDYVSKWGVECELTKWHLKSGKNSFSPFQLLDVYLTTEDENERKLAYNLFREYQKAFKGFRQLYWSKDLKKKYGLNDLTDDEVMELSEKSEFVGYISKQDWKVVLKSKTKNPFFAHKFKGDCRAEILKIASNGSIADINLYITSLKNIREVDKLFYDIDYREMDYREKMWEI